MAVSKPAFRAWAMNLSRRVTAPASTRQKATAVAPFQLA
jgi:hypothetical protein